MDSITLDRRFHSDLPQVLVVACSDGRLQEATDEFLARELGILRYDRLYAPGGAGALSASGCDFVRAIAWRRECRFLVEAHQVEHIVLMCHGPAPDGPPSAVCGDYRRKQAWAKPEQIRAQQETDMRDLLERRAEFAGDARLSAYRFEVTASGAVNVVTLHAEPGLLADQPPAGDQPDDHRQDAAPDAPPPSRASTSADAGGGRLTNS